MKKRLKQVLGIILLLTVVLTLSACSQHGFGAANKPPSGGPYGFIFKYLGVPFQNLMLYTSRTIGGAESYAWGIIIISFVVRLLLLPLSLIQQKKATVQQEKLKVIQPQMKLIQEHQKKAKTPEEQTAISQLMMKVYSQNNIKLTGGIGCLPLLLQLPIFVAIYQAVQYSPEISRATFWGAPLAKPNVIIAVVATIFYVIQAWMQSRTLPAEQKQQMQMMLLMNPAITFFISITYSAALALYFLIGGIIIVIQQAINDYIVTPRVRQQVDADLKAHPIVTVVTEDTFKDLAQKYQTTQSTAANSQVDKQLAQQHQRNRQRNAGKQQHHSSHK